MNTATQNQKPVRITKRDRFNDIIALLTGEEVSHGTTTTIAIDFIKNEIELLNKKNKGGDGTSKAQTKLQQENEKYKADILVYLIDNPGTTCTEIYKGMPEFAEQGYAPQKISALLRQLRLEGKVTSEEGKGGKPLFSAVEGV